jgi:hypothetical protein
LALLSTKFVDNSTSQSYLRFERILRVHDGVHYRNSTIVGNDLGMKVGARVAEKFAPPIQN